ncbi:MAG: chemotaxis protein CheX [Candidatus Binatia bacterium]
MSVPTSLLDSLVSATEEVFDTMLAIPLASRPPVCGPLDTPANVVATVAFAGHRKGLVVVYSSIAAARHITSAMLGIPLHEVNGEVPDAMGEIANMVAGTFRNRLAASEPPSDISVPTVTIGTDFSTLYSSAVQRSRCPFDMLGEPLSVELILTGDQHGAGH